jgi:4-amino-4-deoxy-L-arabinose transferase-like glycosyltransferase
VRATDGPARPRLTPALGLLVFGLGVVVAMWAGSWAAPTGDDTSKYDALARNVIAGRGLSTMAEPPFDPSAARAPVYPLFLASIYAVAGPSPFAVLVVQSVVLGAAWVLLADLATRLFTRRVGILAGLLAALNPYLARTAGGVLTEALFMALVVALIWAFANGLLSSRARWFAMTGVLWAGATLCRPATLVLLPLMVATVWVFVPAVVRSLRLAGVLLLCGLAGMAPWAIRNYVQFQEFIPLQTHAFGLNFWLTTIDPLDRPTATWAGKLDDLRKKYPELEAFYQIRGSVAQKAAEEHLIEIGRERVRQHPWRYVGERLRALPRLWIHSGRLWYSDVSFSDARAAGRYGVIAAKLLLMLLLSIAPLALACAGTWLYRHRWRQLLPLWLVPASLLAVQLPTWVEERYGMPAVPFFLVLAAGALLWRDTPADARHAGERAANP